MGSPPSRSLWPAWAFLPAVYLAAGLVLRHDGGPFWIWHLVDPSYYYLFDSLNLALGQAPGHPYHPGTPVQMIGALLLHMVHRGVGGDMLVERVLADPEGTLRVLSTGLLCVTAAAMFAAGLLAHRWLGDWAAGLMVQAGPFLSKVVLKNAYHVKPEPLLTALMLVLVVVVIWALRPGVAERHKTALAVLFGLIAGLGVATKLTAAPIFVLPLFLLWGWRPLVLYGLVSAGALALFTLPAWPAFHKFWALFVEASLASGAYGQGARTLIDIDTYPQAVLKIFSRPVLHGVFLACLGTALAAAWRARRRGAPWPAEARAAAGLALAILAQVLVVAKQPTANYMVPAYALGGLGIVLTQRCVAGLGLGGAGVKRAGRALFVVLVAALVGAQGWGLVKLDRDQRDKRAVALSVDNDVFAACARIYAFPPSSASFALYRGSWEGGLAFRDAVDAHVPDNDYWFNQNTMELRDAHRAVDVAQVAAGAPCVMVRGAHRGPILTHLREKVPDLAFTSHCDTRDEMIIAAGISCDGILSTK